MKKLLAVLLAVAMLLSMAACGGTTTAEPTPETPAAPVEPETPVVPETPAAPVEPETPVVPETPAAPVEPETPVVPETPAAPVEPETPVVPETPAAPVEPETPVVPETPVAPVEPETPVVPETPVAPVEPVAPVVPETPAAPAEPVAPVVPETPAAPAEPVAPVVPETPAAPVEPETPVVPETPVAPVEPVAPVVPETPAAPVEPVAPVVPETPAAPVEPAAPAVPETPVTPAQPPKANIMATVVTGSKTVEANSVAEILAAVDKSGNSVITLYKDVVSTAIVDLPATCTIDLNGYTLTYEEGNALNIKTVGSQNKVTTIKNGTIIGKCAIAWRAGGLVVDNCTLIALGSATVQILNHSGATKTAADFKDINVIRNSTLYSEPFYALSFNSTGMDFSAVSIRIENSRLITATKNVLLGNQLKETKPGTYVLGENVQMYTLGNGYARTADPAATVTGKEVKASGEGHTVTVNGSELSDLKLWTTGEIVTAAGSAAPEKPLVPVDQLTAAEQAVLQARRDAAEAYVRSVTKVRWRSDVDLSYFHGSGTTNPFVIVAGRLYEGIPYSYAGASLGTWLDHPGTMDNKGVYNMTGLNAELLGKTSTSARLGIDCSGTVNRSWQSIGANMINQSTNAMTVNNGYIKVGEYTAPETSYSNTVEDCAKNGAAVMYEAYAKLQQSDAVVMYNGSNGHAMFVVGVNVVRDNDGTIIGGMSTCTVIDQNGIMREEKKYYDEAAGEDVYVCLRVDYDFTFTKLFQQGYLPLTHRIFLDPTPIADPVITDTVASPDIANLFTGTIKSTWALDNVTVTITDKNGKTVQSSVLHPQRRTEFAVKMSQLQSDPEDKLVGKLDLSKLTSGNYHCNVTVRTVSGQTFTVRDFDFKA